MTRPGVPQVPFAATGDATGWFVIDDIDRRFRNNIEVSARAELGPSTIRGVAVHRPQSMDGLWTVR